ncbi:MAG: Ig-like domain-containing protein [Candidatus Riflebacteria bacterium]
MKKFFSFTFAMFLMISVIGLVGCNGLWDFDDDDDVLATPINFKIPAAINLANVDNTFLAAVVAGGAADYSNLKANVYKKATDAATADTLVNSTPLSIAANGTFNAEFQGYAGTYYVKIYNPNNAGFVLYVYFENLTANVTTTQNITETTTAVGIAIQAAKKDGRVVTSTDIPAATLTTLTTTVTTTVTDSTKKLTDLETDATFKDATKVAVTGVTLNKATLALAVGGSETLTATVAPTTATVKTVTWASDNTAVATVDTTGKVTAVAIGTANITVTADGGKTAVCAVTVTAAIVPVTGVTLNKSTTSIVVGANETLVATVAPTNASTQTVTWSSNATTVATVDTTGKVTGVSAGTATITVTTTDGSKTATCVVTVTAAPVGQTVTLTTAVTTGTTTGMQIKITGISAGDETTLESNTTMKVTLPAGGTNYDFVVNKTISSLVPGVVMTVNTTNLATFDSFSSLSFNENLPTGFAISVTQGGTEVSKN